MKKIIPKIVFLSLSVFITPIANATPVLDSLNGHWYDYVESSDTGWQSAKDAASNSVFRGMKGYLATISDSAENDFIASILHGNAYLGASNLPNGQFSWVTGEQFSYTNWGAGEPNNAPNSATGENFLMMWHSPEVSSQYATDPNGTWNDVFNYNITQAITNNSNGYITG